MRGQNPLIFFHVYRGISPMNRVFFHIFCGLPRTLHSGRESLSKRLTNTNTSEGSLFIVPLPGNPHYCRVEFFHGTSMA
jgi:hypothetical protein